MILNSLTESEVIANYMEVVPNSIIQGDCLNVMSYIRDKSIDCIITDLPYG